MVVRIGHLRFTEHRTREEIWRELTGHTPTHRSPVALSERHVQNLLDVYLALLRAAPGEPAGRGGAGGGDGPRALWDHRRP